jgi:hypothetical protein
MNTNKERTYTYKPIKHTTKSSIQGKKKYSHSRPRRIQKKYFSGRGTSTHNCYILT